MFTVELTLKGSPIALSVQRKDKETAEALYKSIAEAISGKGASPILELTCDKQETKKLAVIVTEISAIQISEKAGATANMGVGFVQ
ncbi:hypothetical protein TUMEXPCC7403_05460 [Tumidithrix helvetica PCC 7403]|uniref:hypothetical protein n=1 Tax=Tumidithrix helvetica TaxID=3457545 RepID=UPI003CAA2AF9